ncbi:MAG: endonuclease/exonuclease/phosphatase family protein [Reyranellaceae bacterium]
MRRLLVRGLSMAATGLLLAVALGHGGGLVWWLDILANFQLQYVMAGAALLLPALLLRQWRTAALTLAALGLSALTLFQVPVQEAGGTAAPVPALTVASFNVLFNNRVADAAVKFAAAEQPDVIVFQEFSKSWLPSLEKLREHYPHQATFALNGGGTDVVLVSRHPLIEPRLVEPDDRRIRVLTAGIEIEGRRLQIVALHPPVPLLPHLAAIRDRHFALVAELAKASPHPTILVGDFNATLWSAPLRRLFAQTDLRAPTRWPEPTYAAIFPWPTRIPIDHVLVSSGLQITSLRKAQRFGSDHFPIMARVAISRSK